MEWLKIFLLAVFQGIAEFLPISSSGHLAVLGDLLGIDPEANFTLGIVLHAGTLLAIAVFYFRSLWEFVKLRRNRLACMIVLGSVPAGVIGLLFKKKVEEWAGNMWVVGACFLFTAAVLFVADRLRKKRELAGAEAIPADRIGWKQALGIGCAQALALMPGISRSGSTIAAGLTAGLSPAAAAEFSFLLAIPAIGGAAFLETVKLFRDGAANLGHPGGLVMGFLVSAAVGYFSLALLLKVLKRGRLAAFSAYLVLAAAAVLIRQAVLAAA